MEDFLQRQFLPVIWQPKIVKKYLFILITLLCISVENYGQDIQTIDNLNNHADQLLNFNADSASMLAKKAVELSKNANYEQGEAEGLSYLCFTCYIKGDYEKAKEYCEESIQIGEKVNAEKGLTMAYHALGLVYINQNKNDEAIKLFSKLVEIASKGNNPYILADALSNLGLAYLNKRYFDKSQEFLLAAIKVYKTIEHPHGEVFANLNYGRSFFEQNAYDSALHYLKVSEKIAQQINNERAMIHTNSMLGQINISENNINEALDHFLEAYEISVNLDLLWEKANLSAWLCETYYKLNDFDNAIYFGEIAINLAKNANIIYILQKVNNILAKSYLENKDYITAENHVQYMEFLIDSLALIDSTNLTNSIIDLNILKTEEQNLEIVSHELAVAKAEIARRNLLLIGTVLASFLLAAILGLIIKSNKMKTRTNNELRELNQRINGQKENLEEAIKALDAANKEKDLLVGMVAHDIRSPLQKISGLVNILQLQSEMDDGQLEVCGLVQKTITDANKLADELLEINKIESGALEKNQDDLTLSEFIKQVIDQFKPVAEKKNIKLVIDQKCPDRKFTTDRKLLQRIFENLVSNAIKFSQKNTTVTIEVACQKDKIKFNVIDEGVGIPEDEHKYLFTKFGKTSSRPTGGEPSNGLGLYIVNELTKSLGGNLDFRSKVGEGSQFAILLPVN